MRLLISGGHLTPALALIDYIKQNQPDAEIVFVGRVYNRRKDQQPSPEKREIEKRGIPFVAFESGKFGEGSFLTKIAQSSKTIMSVIVAFFIVGKVQPTTFVSFGGYLAVPLAIASWLWRVPIITHEQTRTIGVANKLMISLVKTIAFSYEDTVGADSLPKGVITGNPVRQSLFEKPEKPIWLKSKTSKPILYITGGSQGSEVINSTVARSIDALLKNWLVIHQCGFASKERNYEAELSRIKMKVSKVKQDRYFIRTWIEEKELAWIYNNATAAITRGGANTIMEITLKSVPSIIIPLPFSNQDEQLLNAKALSDQKAAILLLQKDLNPDKLLSSLSEIFVRQASIRKQLKKIATLHEDASKNLFVEIQKLHR
jgi:UDP-N-acetylglucosamine--N-acetylmuramyl-(pentapeptide) pyrophosphoryl-undecaprenol N-acetylglucosamine transferase